MATARRYDLYSDEFRRRTYETFAEMREHDPVLQQPGIDGEVMIWFVTRYADVVTVLTDEERFARDPANALPPDEVEAVFRYRPPELRSLDDNMLNKDGEDHRRLRRLVTKAFTPRMVERLRPRIEAIADELIDAVEGRGQMNLVDEFAFPLPIVVIAELLGIPAGDRDRFRSWSSVVVTPALDPEAQERAITASREFHAYLSALFEERCARPRDDLVSALVQVEDGGDMLSEGELFGMVALLIVAGHETTVSLIGNAVVTLLEHPEDLERLKLDPSRTAAAVEELLRFDSPVERTLARWARTDVELGGQTIRTGDAVIAILGAANRDGGRFDDADAFVLSRSDNKHVAFGRGSHYCLGAPLARLEAEIALSTLFRRLPGLRLAVSRDELAWRPIPIFHSLVELPVAWD